MSNQGSLDMIVEVLEARVSYRNLEATKHIYADISVSNF